MSTPNPLVPEGSLQQSKGKSNVKIAVFTILAIHAVLLVGLLMQGCKEKPKPVAEETTTSLTNDATASIPTLPAGPDTTTAATLPSTSPTAVPAAVPSTAGSATTAPAALPATTGATTVSAPVSVPAATVDTAATAATKEYAIASGDTLGKVAKENHISLKALLAANPNINPTKLQIGQKIQIPAADAAAAPKADASAAADAGAGKDDGVYVVKAGDVLERIAKSHGTSVKAIKTANNLKTDRLKVGQKLKLPAAKVAATADVAPVAPESPLATTPLTPTTTVASAKK